MQFLSPRKEENEVLLPSVVRSSYVIKNQGIANCNPKNYLPANYKSIAPRKCNSLQTSESCFKFMLFGQTFGRI